jgi:hypothetical protein
MGGRDFHLLGVALVICLLMLGACSSGGADDSRRFQNEEAEQTPQLPGAQATQFARQFGSPEASPEPTITPHAGISELVLASSVNNDGSPGNTIQSVPAGSSQTLYAAARITNIQPGQYVAALLRTEDGGVIATSEQSPGASSSPQWVNFPFQLGGLGRGSYSVAIVIGDDLLESIAFDVR